jgi:hypothetical protein
VDMTGKWKVMIKFSVPCQILLHLIFESTSSIQTYVTAFLLIGAYNTIPQFNIILTTKCVKKARLFMSLNALEMRLTGT